MPINDTIDCNLVLGAFVMEVPEDERREGKRVSADFDLNFVSIEDLPEEDLSKDSISDLQSHEIDEVLTRLNNISDEINRIKKYLQDASDMLTGGIVARVVDLSCTGVSFITDKEFEVSKMIQVRFALPAKQRATVTALGEVVRVIKCDDEELFNVALKFTEITEKDESAIIRYTFFREREEAKEKAEKRDE